MQTDKPRRNALEIRETRPPHQGAIGENPEVPIVLVVDLHCAVVNQLASLGGALTMWLAPKYGRTVRRFGARRQALIFQMPISSKYHADRRKSVNVATISAEYDAIGTAAGAFTRYRDTPCAAVAICR